MTSGTFVLRFNVSMNVKDKKKSIKQNQSWRPAIKQHKIDQR